MANTESKQHSLLRIDFASRRRRTPVREGAILQQLIKNSERLVIVEDISQLKQDVSQLKQDMTQLRQDIELIKPKVESIDRTLGTVKWILVTIALAIVANIFSQPITSWLFS